MTRAGCLAEDKMGGVCRCGHKRCFRVSGRDDFGQGCRVDGRRGLEKPGLGITYVKKGPRALGLCLHKAR